MPRPLTVLVVLAVAVRTAAALSGSVDGAPRIILRPIVGPVIDAGADPVNGTLLERVRDTAVSIVGLVRDKLSAAANDSSTAEDSEALMVAPGVKLQPRVVCFNVMVAGLSGLGKTTTCNMLFESWSRGERHHLESASSSEKTKSKRRTVLVGGKRIRASTRHIDVSRCFERFDARSNTLLRVRVIDTPGFGNNVDNKDAVRPITKYVARCREAQFSAQMAARDPTADGDDALVHVCVYFLSPHRFLEIDRHFLRAVQRELAVVPIIAKSDTLTDDEMAEYREMLVESFTKHHIRVYDLDGAGQQPPHHHPQAAAAEGRQPRAFDTSRGRQRGEPLAIVSRDGLYPWGEARVFDRAHSDFALLKDHLLSEHTERLVDHAKARYAAYRARRVRRKAVVDFFKSVAFLGLVLNTVVPRAWTATLGRRATPILGALARLKKIRPSSHDDDGNKKKKKTTAAEKTDAASTRQKKEKNKPTAANDKESTATPPPSKATARIWAFFSKYGS